MYILVTGAVADLRRFAVEQDGRPPSRLARHLDVGQRGVVFQPESRTRGSFGRIPASEVRLGVASTEAVSSLGAGEDSAVSGRRVFQSSQVEADAHDS
jgi:hypothetical protein